MATEVESAWSPARKFRLVKPTFKGLEQSKIVEDQPGHLKKFGIYICMSDDGQIAIVGGNSTSSGGGKLFHCFKKSGSTWTKYQTIMPDSSYGPQDPSYKRMALSGDGSIFTFSTPDPASLYDSRVFIYKRNPDDDYSLVRTYQTEGVLEYTDLSLSKNGNTLAIGTQGPPTAAGEAHIVSINTVSPFQATRVAIIKSPENATNDWFGLYARISGDGNSLIVGAGYLGGGRKAPYIFVRSGGSWIFESQLPYHESIASYEKLYITDDGSKCMLLSPEYGVSTFQRTGGNWNFKSIIPDPSTSYTAMKSFDISRDGLTCVIGCPSLQGDVSEMGDVYVYVRSDSNSDWSLKCQIRASDTTGSEEFGTAVALNQDGRSLLVACTSATVGSVQKAGAVYSFA